jgi:hypothetical protein
MGSGLQHTRDRLRELAARLGAFAANSEGAFLEAGGQLAALQTRAEAVVATCRGALTLGAGEGDDDPAARLDAELGRLADYLRSSREASAVELDALARVLAAVEALTRGSKEIEDVPRSLRVLGMTTRIENSRAPVPNEGMETVAAEVRRMADLVDGRFQQLLRYAASVCATASAARGTTAEFLERHGASSAGMLAETRDALESLRTLAASEAAAVATARGASEDVMRSIAGVVVSLQCHDASRQRIEHVVEELRAFEADAAAARAEDEAAWAVEASRTCGVLAAQLRGAREALATAIATIVRELGAVASRVADVAAEAGRVAGSGAGDAPVARVRSGVALATRALEAHLVRAEDTAVAVRNVSESARAMAGELRDVGRLGSDVRIIALNALVETHRAGEGGRVLAVLAQEMGSVAGAVVRHTADASKALSEIGAAAGALERDAWASSGGEAIAAALEELLTRLALHHGGLQAGLGALREGGVALREEVDALGRRFAVQERELSALAAVEERLAAIAAEPPPEGADPAAAVRRSSASARYTMNAERDIHGQALGEAPSTRVEPAPVDASGFGSNVDLF